MKRQLKKGSFLLALLCLSSCALFSQTNPFDSVLQVLDTRYPQEKLYLHFDRTFYNPGETIWFKAYLFAANLPSRISKSVYAELLDEKGKVLQRKVAPVLSSGAAAAFDLPADLRSSTVYVRAYTDWMLNFDSSFIYNRSIAIIQPDSAAHAKARAPKSFLQFFPESGDLVEGVESRVAFKATDAHGLPYKVSGNIVDSKGNTVTAFNTMHDGMGFFVLEPKPNEKYRASWKDASGKTQVTNLPDAEKEGVVLRMDQDATGLIFTLSRPDMKLDTNAFVYIVGQMQQQMVYLATARIAKNEEIKGRIPVDNIPAGIVQMTVFSAEKKPLAERIVFINKPDYYFITDLNGALKDFDKRKKNVFQVDVPDTIATNLSVSVTDASVNPYLPGEEDIFSHVLLTSDIKGYVHNPGYYFSSEVDSVFAHRDLVMMTNGWRRFRWEDALAGKFPAITHLPADYIAINGKINGLTKSQLTQKELTGILDAEGKQEFVSIPVNPDGTFTVPGLVFYDSAKLYYQFNNDKDKTLTSRASFDIKNNLNKGALALKIDSNWAYSAMFPAQDVLLQNKNLSDKNLTVLGARRKVQTLESVTVTARQKTKEQQMDEQYASGLFRGGDGYTFVTQDDPLAVSSISVLNYLQGKVAGLQITGQGMQMNMSWRGGTPALFLNEVQSDVNMIQSMSMSDVAMVKVFRPPFMGAPGGGSGGAIAVYTKKGAALNANVKGMDFANIAGYSPVKEFYSPDYSKYEPQHADADYRTTLYWNPFLITDKNNRRLLFTFYNNDVTRRFRIVIEGCDANGKLTRIEKVFE